MSTDDRPSWREQIHEAAEQARAEDRARKGKPPKEAKPAQEPAADDGTFSTGEKIAVGVIGVPLAAGFLWLVHTFAPAVFGLGVIIAIIAAIAFIWHVIGEAVKRG